MSKLSRKPHCTRQHIAYPTLSRDRSKLEGVRLPLATPISRDDRFGKYLSITQVLIVTPPDGNDYRFIRETDWLEICVLIGTVIYSFLLE